MGHYFAKRTILRFVINDVTHTMRVRFDLYERFYRAEKNHQHTPLCNDDESV